MSLRAAKVTISHEEHLISIALSKCVRCATKKEAVAFLAEQSMYEENVVYPELLAEVKKRLDALDKW